MLEELLKVYIVQNLFIGIIKTHSLLSIKDCE